MPIKLDYKIVNTPDLSGFKFYVAEGDFFDVDAYAEAYNIEVSDIDAQIVHSIEDIAGGLHAGQWLEVMHNDVV